MSGYEEDNDQQSEADHSDRVRVALHAIEDAFGKLKLPSNDEVVGEVKDNLDALELAAAFQGRHWREVSISDLMFHREALSILAPVGFRFYLPAYMTASLKTEKYRADIREYTILSLRVPYDRSGRPIESLRYLCRRRLDALDEKQRGAVRAFLRAIRSGTGALRSDPVMVEWGIE